MASNRGNEGPSQENVPFHRSNENSEAVEIQSDSSEHADIIVSLEDAGTGVEADKPSDSFGQRATAWFRKAFTRVSTVDPDQIPKEEASLEQQTKEERLPLPSVAPKPDPVCLICLEPLTPEDWHSGRAISLDCQCRGDLALRHKDCAIKWSQVKGNNQCELCRQPVRNIPAPPPPPQPAPVQPHGSTEEEYYGGWDPALGPSPADVVFDTIRVAWLGMIISILFFGLPLGAAMWTGLAAALMYSLAMRVMYRRHFQVMRALAEQQAAGMHAV